MTSDALKNPFAALVEALTASREARLMTRVAQARRQRREALAAVQAEVEIARAHSLEVQNQAA